MDSWTTFLGNMLFAAFALAMVAFITFKFVLKGFIQTMRDRAKEVDDGYKKVEQTQIKSKLANEELKAQKLSLENEVDSIIREAKAEATSNSNEIIDNAQIKANKKINDAREIIQNEQVKAKHDFAKQVVATSKKVVEQALTKDVAKSVSKKITEKQVKNLEDNSE